jgi:hypothetical protein
MGEERRVKGRRAATDRRASRHADRAHRGPGAYIFLHLLNPAGVLASTLNRTQSSQGAPGTRRRLHSSSLAHAHPAPPTPRPRFRSLGFGVIEDAFESAVGIAQNIIPEIPNQLRRLLRRHILDDVSSCILRRFASKKRWAGGGGPRAREGNLDSQGRPGEGGSTAHVLQKETASDHAMILIPLL